MRILRPELVVVEDELVFAGSFTGSGVFGFGGGGADTRGRATTTGVAAELEVPNPLVNRLMGNTFRAERHRVADSSRKPFPFGLSLLAVARKTEG